MILNIRQLSKFFGEQCILDDIELSIEEPTIMALVAPNGTGKSTLLNIITNIESGSFSEITLLGKKHDDPTMFQKVTYLQDNSVLYGELTGWDHLNFISQLHNLTKAQVLAITDRLNMTGY